MDDFPRGRRIFLSLATVIAGVACAPPRNGSPVGVSSPRAPEPIAKHADGGEGEPPVVRDDFRRHMTAVRARFLSRGHGEKFDAVLWANDKARAGWETAVDMDEGAVLVEEAIERSAAGDRPAGLLVMSKRSGAWHFASVGPGGDVASPERTAPCAQCHAEAPRDFVFVFPAASP